MAVVAETISKCPVCGAETLEVRANGVIACKSCGSEFELVQDPRLATLKLTIKQTAVKGWERGATVLSIPNMDVVHRSAAAAQAHG